ncbi:DEKNAAC104053 [Brettanomyces naardenensis]|uniref:DEKNAAC104053 n=1 Tax=Brettanomyces naardenensis TaxID=13370 RepID=A0A448YQJ0_BRENA|nr:DEKNAAC104053 [Brettanomyces naardenensis]
MTKLPWFIPQRRNLPEDFDNKIEEEGASTGVKPLEKTDIDEKVELYEKTESVEAIEPHDENTLAVLQDHTGEIYQIREFRDVSTRPWWKFFDEFEYRETQEESARYQWSSWFRKGTSKEEKKLLWKLDLLVTFYSFVGYWIKFIDSNNVTNAYVSNMKEDLGMKGNDLINTQVIFNVGTAVFEIPWIFLLPNVPINYALSISELGWSVFTLVTYKATTVPGLQAMRFIVGSFEAAYFPCIHYLLGSWYLPSEVSRRGGFFYIGQFLGVLTSGLLQGAVFQNLDGNNGLPGWRWMFIIDGVISMVVGFYGIISIPGTPFSCYSIFLTDDEIRLARKRMIENGTDSTIHSKGFFNKSKWKEAFSTWHVYLLSAINLLFFNVNSSSSGSFVLWLKSLNKYSIPRINNLSTLPPALGIIYIVIICFSADFTRKRFICIMVCFLLNFIANFILALWDVPNAAKWYGFLSVYWSWSLSSVFYLTISDMFRRDNEVRSVAWMVIYTFGLQSQVWISRLIWPTVESPRFPKGFSTCAGFSLAADVLLPIAYLLYKRDEKRDSARNGIFIYDSRNRSLKEALDGYEIKYERKGLSGQAELRDQTKLPAQTKLTEQAN